jgi:cytochrome c-type biogenesis protein CcmH/NrfG
MLRCTATLAACLFVLCAPGDAAAKWTTLRSPNFLFVGDASESQIRDVANQLEEFRQAMARVLPATAGASPVPTTVIVFQSEASIGPYRPQFQGRAVNVGGYFQPSEDLNYITVLAEHSDFALHAIFHEYSHFLVNSTTGTIPVWVNEGLAEVYSTFEERNGGRSALIGRAPAEHVGLLQQSTLMPIRDLLAVGHDSPVYNEGSPRGVFYAQSWALVHYLTLGSKERAGQLVKYLDALRVGTAEDQAFREAFGESRALEQELAQYIRQVAFPAIQFNFDEKVGAGRVGRGEPIADADARAYLGDLLSRMRGSADQGKAMLSKLLAERPDSVRAAVSLGMLHLRERHVDDALALLKPAVGRAPGDGPLHGTYGRALVMKLSDEGNADGRESLIADARAALGRAIELDPANVMWMSLLGYLELRTGTDLPRAVSLFEKASQLAPVREQYRLMLAEALMRQRDFTRATAVLGPLVAFGHTKEARDGARERLGIMAEMQKRIRDAEARAAIAATTAPTSTSPTSTPPTSDVDLVPRTPLMAVLEPDGGKTYIDSGVRPSDPGATLKVIPALRVVAADETRVLGMFFGVDCGSTGVVLQVTVEGRTLRLSARRFDEVEFISYIENAPASISCGVFGTASRVLATYRTLSTPAAGVDGQAVAIELIPEGYTPRVR